MQMNRWPHLENCSARPARKVGKGSGGKTCSDCGGSYRSHKTFRFLIVYSQNSWKSIQDNCLLSDIKKDTYIFPTDMQLILSRYFRISIISNIKVWDIFLVPVNSPFSSVF